MALDEKLSKRFRDALPKKRGYSEQKMMGGLCFMLNGNMIGGADRTKEGQGRFMFRIGKDFDVERSGLPGAPPMVMGGRRMRGFYFVDEKECNEEALRDWINASLEFVGTLPKKQAKK